MLFFPLVLTWFVALVFIIVGVVTLLPAVWIRRSSRTWPEGQATAIGAIEGRPGIVFVDRDGRAHRIVGRRWLPEGQRFILRYDPEDPRRTYSTAAGSTPGLSPSQLIVGITFIAMAILIAAFMTTIFLALRHFPY